MNIQRWNFARSAVGERGQPHNMNHMVHSSTHVHSQRLNSAYSTTACSGRQCIQLSGLEVL